MPQYRRARRIAGRLVWRARRAADHATRVADRAADRAAYLAHQAAAYFTIAAVNGMADAADQRAAAEAAGGSAHEPATTGVNNGPTTPPMAPHEEFPPLPLTPIHENNMRAQDEAAGVIPPSRPWDLPGNVSFFSSP